MWCWEEIAKGIVIADGTIVVVFIIWLLSILTFEIIRENKNGK
jgi:hypothetical protein